MVAPHSVCNRRADCIRTTPDDLCCHPPRRSAASLKDKDAFGSGRVGDPCRPFWNQSAPSETIDSNSSWRLATSRSAARTSAGPQRDVDTGQVESGGAAPRWLLTAPRRRAASVDSLSRTHRSWMSTASNGGPATKSPPARAPRAADPVHEELHEAGDAADVLRQAPPLAVDERLVVDSGSHSDARPDCQRDGRVASLPRLFLLRLGFPPGCPVLAHPLGDGPALLVAHRALPPADRLGRLLPAAPDGRREVSLDRLDRALYGNELALERALLVP